jgi:hypothetical protein
LREIEKLAQSRPGDQSLTTSFECSAARRTCSGSLSTIRYG